MRGGEELPNALGKRGVHELRAEALVPIENTSTSVATTPHASDLTQTTCATDVEVEPGADLLLLLDLLASGLVDGDLNRRKKSE